MSENETETEEQTYSADDPSLSAVQWRMARAAAAAAAQPEPVVETPAQNTRLPRAARVLRNQMFERFGEVEWNGSGDADGLGVVRSIWFAGETAEFLRKVLPVLEDERIDSWQSDDDGDTDRVVITFVDNTRADEVEPFPMDAAAVIAGEEPVQPEVSVQEAEAAIIDPPSEPEEPEEEDTPLFRDETEDGDTEQ